VRRDRGLSATGIFGNDSLMQAMEFLLEIVADTIREVVANILGRRAEESVRQHKKKNKATRRILSRDGRARRKKG
jgi:hypothetical protein